MRMNRICVVLAVALVGAGAGIAVVSAAAPTTASPAATTGRAHWRGHRDSPMLGVLLRATRQLNLTADQQQSIKSLMASARAQRRAAAGAGPDLTVLGNPGDPEYATAVQSAKSAAAGRIDAEVALQGQIYDVLTTEQKQQLPQVLAAMKAKFQHKAAWQQHAASGGAAG